MEDLYDQVLHEEIQSSYKRMRSARASLPPGLQPHQVSSLATAQHVKDTQSSADGFHVRVLLLMQYKSPISMTQWSHYRWLESMQVDMGFVVGQLFINGGLLTVWLF